VGNLTSKNKKVNHLQNTQHNDKHINIAYGNVHISKASITKFTCFSYTFQSTTGILVNQISELC